MSKVGPEVHVEPFGDRGLKLQTTNAARSVYFQIIYKSDYFQETDEQSQSQVFIYKCVFIQGVIIRPIEPRNKLRVTDYRGLPETWLP